jgi:hypothetical protein
MSKIKYLHLTIVFVFSLATIMLSCSKDSSVSPGSNQSGVGGSLARFTVAGNYLYIVDNSNLHTYNISNASTPVFESSIVIGAGTETIFPYKNNLYIGSQTGMFVYSIASPGNPTYLGQASHVRSCDPVIANDTAAFVTLRSGSGCGSPNDGLYIYNTTNLFQPQLIKTVDIATPYGLGLKDNVLYVCGGSNGLTVVNVANIYFPQIIRVVNDYDFRDVIPYQNLLICYVTDGIALYDISNAQNPVLIKKINNQ